MKKSVWKKRKENVNVDQDTLLQLFVELIYVGLVVGLVVEATL